MAPYIFGKRNLIHIIDVRETLKGLVRASNFLSQVGAQGKEIVFVGTKRQAKSIIQREAQRCGNHWVTERWLGGTLTNINTIRKRLKRLIELEGLEESGGINQYSKKAVSRLRRERRKICTNLDGLRKMEKLPACVILVDIRREHIAVREARKCGIPVIALVDTDCDPDLVDIVIPANDDAFRSIEIVLTTLADSFLIGKEKYAALQAEEEKKRLEEEEKQKEEAAKKQQVKDKEREAEKERENIFRQARENEAARIEAAKSLGESATETAKKDQAAEAVTGKSSAGGAKEKAAEEDSAAAGKTPGSGPDDQKPAATED